MADYPNSMYPSLAPPFVDADRNRMIHRPPRKPTSASQLRARFAIAFAVVLALRLFLRVNSYFLR
jgi:hypothetical protein